MPTQPGTIAAQAVRFQLFDGVEAVTGEERIDLGTARERCLLVALLAAKGRAIPRFKLHEWIWDEPPNSATGDLDGFMTRLRGRLRQLGLSGALNNRDGHCRLEVPAESVDVHRFEALVSRARAAEDRQAATLLDQALRLSAGEPLAGVSSRRIDNYRRALREDRFTAELSFLQRELRLGRHRERLSDLLQLGTARPTDATVAAYTMFALYQAGRQEEGLALFTAYRRRLDHRALEPPPMLRDLQREILRNGDCRFAIGDTIASPPPSSTTMDGDTLPIPHKESEAAQDAAAPPPSAVASLTDRHLVILAGKPQANRVTGIRLLNTDRLPRLTVVDVVKTWDRPNVTALLPPRQGHGYLLTLNDNVTDRPSATFAEDLLNHAQRLASCGSYLVVLTWPDLWRDCWPVAEAVTVRFTAMAASPVTAIDREHLRVTDPGKNASVLPLERRSMVRMGREAPGDPPPDIVLDSGPLSPISRHHGQLEYRGGWWFEPTGKNAPSIRRRGTGERERVDDRVRLVDGDVILIEVNRSADGKPRMWELEFRDPQRTSTFQGDDQ